MLALTRAMELGPLSPKRVKQMDDSLVVAVDVGNPPYVLQVKTHPSQFHLAPILHMVSYKGTSNQ